MALQDFATGIPLPQLVLGGLDVLRLDQDVADDPSGLGLDLENELTIGRLNESRMNPEDQNSDRT